MDGVIPPVAAIDQCPNLTGAKPRRRGDPAEVRSQHLSTSGMAAIEVPAVVVTVVRADAPRRPLPSGAGNEGRDRIIGSYVRILVEYEGPILRYGNVGKIGVGDQDCRYLTHIRPNRITHNSEFQERAHAWIARCARECLGDGEVRIRFEPGLMFSQVHHLDPLSDAVAGEVDDDVITLCNSLLVQLSEGHRSRQQVAIIGNLDHGRAVAQRDLEEAGNRGVEDAEAILPALDL